MVIHSEGESLPLPGRNLSSNRLRRARRRRRFSHKGALSPEGSHWVITSPASSGSLLYKFGDVYLDTHVIVLRRLTRLRKVIGAQTSDGRTGNWTRLNNVVLAFDKGHRSCTSSSRSKRGHNVPYLGGRPGIS
ncbi:hypothetical protein SAY87_010045 [Trapa incisa]|uniref:Uncharacterized protein n=1 Tax=Trapa incisa TaxID=236973 RepID=A0AAN7GNX7_9MYRT|nr:hypothetical protein SAY87_010045 [Trapa incisa]